MFLLNVPTSGRRRIHALVPVKRHRFVSRLGRGLVCLVFSNIKPAVAHVNITISRGVTTAPADPAMQGARGPRGPKLQAARKYCLHCKTLLYSGVYGFALFDEFVGTNPLDQARFARNVLDFLGCRKFFLTGG